MSWSQLDLETVLMEEGRLLSPWSLLTHWHPFWSILPGQGQPLWSCQGCHSSFSFFPFSAPSLFSLEIFPSPFTPPPPPHSSLLKFIAVLISCHSERLSLIATDERFHVGRSPNRSCQPRGNGREALVIGFLNYVNSSGHLVIGFTVFDGVFEIVLECYWGEQLVKFYSWIQRRKWHL